MQDMFSLQETEREVDEIISSLSLVRVVSAAELIHALQVKERSLDLAPAIAGFLSHAPANLLIKLFLPARENDANLANEIEAMVALANSVQCERTSTLDIELRRALVPLNFPAEPKPAAISGAHPKIALVSYGGKFYEPGTSPPEVLARWELCEDLAYQFVERCQLNEKGKYAHLSRSEILQQYQERLLRTGWGSDADMTWVIHRTATLLSWEPPSNLSNPTTK